MATLVILEAKAKPESVDAVKEMLAKRLPETRAYDGCQSLTAYLNEDDGRTLVIVEYWDSRQHYEKYLAWRTETGVLDEFQTLLEDAPEIRFFEAIDA